VFERIATLLGLRPKTTGVTAAMEGGLAGKLESLLESTADAIVGVGSEGSIALVNPQTEKLFGYLRDEVLGKSVEFLLPEVFQPGILGRRTRFLLDPQTRPMGEGLELHGRRKDGSEFPADVGVSQFKHEELVAVFFIRDMTDIVQAEQALLESREEFREIVESAPDAMVIADSEGWIQLVNAETEELFGYTREELLGKAVDVLVPEDVRSKHREHLAGFFAEPRVWAVGQDLEPHGQRKDGSLFPVDIRLSPLHTKEGILVSSVIRDITERKRAEEEIRQLNLNLERRVAQRTVELEAANRELEAFTYSVSHDLKQPLRSIDGFADMLHRDCADRLDAEGRRCLDVIRSSAAQMEQLINNLLTLSQVGRAALQPGVIDTGELVKTVFEELSSETMGRQLELKLGLLPPIHGDRTLIRQVFANLLSNAIKFTGSKDTAIIEVGCRTDGDEDIYHVADNGAGFDMAYVNKLFRLFERLHYPDEFPGTGVGLAIVGRIVQRHGGRVWAEGKVDEGAIFYVALPHHLRSSDGQPGAANVLGNGP
jgi:PAS domain S-box-containing protein